MVMVGHLLSHLKNCGAGTGDVVCTKCTDDVNIFSITQILAESWMDMMFVELDGIG